jgi:hypothetical protein
MPGKTRRRTRRTDSNGALKEVYREQWDCGQLEKARRAGIPARMLDAAGSDDWRETGSVLGLWSELIYVLDDCMRGVDPLGNPRPDNLGIVEEVFDMMLTITGGLGVESDNLIPWDVWYLRRDLSSVARAEDPTANEVQAAEDALTAQMNVHNTVMGDWGCPSGPEHDSHSHGKSSLGWVCVDE